MAVADNKAKIMAQTQARGGQITELREQVLDIVLQQEGVVKAYTVLAQMQQKSKNVVAPPTAYRALDFWAEQGVLHKVAAVNGYVLCSHARHDCAETCHSHEEQDRHNSAFILVCTECGAVDEQTLSPQWLALRTALAGSGFKLKEEHIVLTGICQKCQA